MEKMLTPQDLSLVLTNERPESDHMTLGPMRGLKKTAPVGSNTQTDGHGNFMTESAQWGPFSENIYIYRKWMTDSVKA